MGVGPTWKRKKSGSDRAVPPTRSGDLRRGAALRAWPRRRTRHRDPRILLGHRRGEINPLPDFFLSRPPPAAAACLSCGSRIRKRISEKNTGPTPILQNSSPNLNRRREEKEKRRFRGEAKGSSACVSTAVSDASVPLARKIPGRPCVGGNPCRAAHQRKRRSYGRNTARVVPHIVVDCFAGRAEMSLGAR